MSRLFLWCHSITESAYQSVEVPVIKENPEETEALSYLSKELDEAAPLLCEIAPSIVAQFITGVERSTHDSIYILKHALELENMLLQNKKLREELRDRSKSSPFT